MKLGIRKEGTSLLVRFEMYELVVDRASIIELVL